MSDLNRKRYHAVVLSVLFFVLFYVFSLLSFTNLNFYIFSSKNYFSFLDQSTLQTLLNDLQVSYVSRSFFYKRSETVFRTFPLQSVLSLFFVS